MKERMICVGDRYTDEDRAFYEFWYSHMQNDVMVGALADVSHSTARYIWDSARNGIAPPPGDK